MGKYSAIIKRVPIYIEMGQSNKDDRGYYPENANGQNGVVPTKYDIHGTNTDMKIFWRSAWNTTKNGNWENVDLFNNTTNPDSLAVGSMYGATVVFSKEMADYKGSQVATIKATKGGTSLWNDWQVGGATWLNAKAHLEDALVKVCNLGIPELKVVSWFQGFSDSDTQAHADAYLTNLNDLITRTNSLINGFIPNWSERWLIQQSPDWSALYGIRPAAYQLTIREAQETVGNYNGNLFLDNSNCVIWSGDDTHLTADSYTQIGLDCFNLLKDL